MSTTAANAQIRTARPQYGTGRPGARAIVAHPSRPARGVARGRVESCVVQRAPIAPRATGWTRLKVGLLGLIAIVGGIVGITGYVSALGPDPAVEHVAGSAAWVHVEK